MKYKLKLTSLQKKLINNFYDHYRFTYNRTVGIINSEVENLNDFSWIKSLGNIEGKAGYNIYYSKFELRNMITSEVCNPFSSWVLETPYQLRAYAVFEAYNRYKTCLANIKKNHIKFFNLGFKTKKSLRWTMDFPKENLIIHKSSKNMFGLYSLSGMIKTTENFKNDISLHDCKIHFDGIGYYLISPYKKPIKKVSNRNLWCSIDPGIRKFLTCFSPEDNKITIIGDKASNKLYNLLLKIDKICSTKPSKKLKLYKIKLLNKVKNLQNELHSKSAAFLCNTYKNIVIPKLTKENDIINKKTCKLKSKTVRNMVVLGHAKFIELLKTKANSYTNTKVHIVTEEYTSQTCLKCCCKTKTSNETFICKSCSYQIDRDVLGSINILKKFWNYM